MIIWKAIFKHLSLNIEYNEDLIIFLFKILTFSVLLEYDITETFYDIHCLNRFLQLLYSFSILRCFEEKLTTPNHIP